MSTESLAKYSDLRLCRVLNHLGRRVGPRTRALREAIIRELAARAEAEFRFRYRKFRRAQS